MKTMSAECGCKFEYGGWIMATCEHGRDFILAKEGGAYKLVEVTNQPLIVCLCGSTRFSEAFQQANYEETLAGKIVLTIGCDTKSDDDLFSRVAPNKKADLKKRLDILHFRKIDLANEVLILNVGGYIGESTHRELEYALAMGKPVRFLEPEFQPPG